MNFRYVNSEVNPAVALVVPARGGGIDFPIELDGGGDLHITIHSMIEPIREMFDAGFQSDHDDQDEKARSRPRARTLRCPGARLRHRGPLKLRDILHIRKPGDVIPVMPEHMVMRQRCACLRCQAGRPRATTFSKRGRASLR